MFAIGWTTGSVVTRFAASRAAGRLKKPLVAAMGQGCGPSKMTSSSSSIKGEVSSAAMTDVKSDDHQYYDQVVCRDADIQEGQMKEVSLAGSGADGKPGPKCLLVRQNGSLTALSPKCTHFGAPLIKGSLGEGVVRCPWHGACFDVTTGDIEDFPGLDSLHKYDVSVDDGGQVRVRAKKSLADGGYRSKTGACPAQVSGKTVVIVGGGPAAQTCAETLRNRAGSAWDGRIVMLTQEATGPYDRTLLSKQLTKTAQDLLLRKPHFYHDQKIELKTDSKVIGLDTEANLVTIVGGDTFTYDYLVLASGSRPRTLANVKGATTVGNIFVLRTPEDGNSIAKRAEGKKVVIVGASFIGMEVAAFLSTKSGATSVTVVGNTRLPFEKTLGKEVGEWIMKLHQTKGNVQFVMGSTPAAFVGDEQGGDAGSLTKVVLADGTELEADLCVLGVGVDPNTDYLKSSAVKTDARGFVEVDENLKSVSTSNIYAVGDIAKFPLNLPFIQADNYSTAIGHWQLALRHGKAAGLNVGSEQPTRVNTVPFFWSMQYGKSLRYAGHLAGGTYDDVIVVGSLEDVDTAKFVAYYMQGDTVAAVASLMRDPVAADFANLALEGKALTRTEATDPDETWRNKYSLQAKA